MNDNEQIINKIKQLQDKHNLSTSELARRMDMPKSTLSRYLNGERQFPLNKVADIADILSTTPQDILGLKNNNLTFETVNVPIIGRVACGEPILSEQNITGYISMPADRVPNGNVFWLQTVGDSMVPTIPIGANVLIRQQPEVEDGEIAAVCVNDSITLKRVKHSNGAIALIPDNSKYSPIILTEENSVNDYIVGKAIEINLKL